MLLAGSLMASAYQGQSPFAGSLRVSLSSSSQFPQEWGTQGVEKEYRDRAGGFRFALPTLHVDSRPSGNARRGVLLRRTEGLVVDSPQDEG